MTEVRIRNVDDWVMAFHRLEARRQGLSLENLLKSMLTASAAAKRQMLVSEIRTDLSELEQKLGTFPDSTPFIRAERDRRG